MKRLKYNLLLSTLLLISSTMYGQNNFASKLEHKIVAGFNFGASAPVPIPAEVRKIEAWWPQFTPQLGYSILYNADNLWGIGSGILLNYKGMGVKDKVKYMYTEVVTMEDNPEKLKGYFVGDNETRVKMAYVTVPLYAAFIPNENWIFRAGGYVSYLFSGQFKGTVSDGYIRILEPTGEKQEIDEASFDFNDDLRSFDFGLTIGAERKINNRFGLYANLDWALTPIFPSSFKAMEFKMYNIYATLGLTYRL